jgi:putative sterol carrier protein
MSVFKDSEQLYAAMKLLFTRLDQEHPQAASLIMGARLIARLKISDPAAEVTINGRRHPPEATYGPSPLHPEVEIGLSAETFHRILLGELGMTQAAGSGKIKIRGPVWKAFVLQDAFRGGQTIYPQVLKEIGLDGYQ